MRKSIIGVLCMAVLLAANACAVRSSAPVTEQTGEPRIISTSAPLCTILDKLDLDLVGIPDTAFAIPERYKNVKIVGAPMTPDFEIVKALNPTDVLSPNALQQDLQPHYQRIGVPSTFVNLLSLDGMFRSIDGLGKKYDRQKQADALISEYRTFMDAYASSVQGKDKPSVLILFGLPGMYMIATEHSYVGSLVKLAGGVNVFDDPEALLSVNTEELIKRDPDIILRTSHALPEAVMAAFEQEFRDNDIWRHFRAVQEERVFDLSNQIFGMSANLNYQEGLNQLREILYEQD
ncbi:heme ABC transporter substrate-binding protein IsdE [Paenibacillus sp. YN15]|uniref:heme ABC transporter substrate-binding protein IsdE n=1 Tax=Paenibacillus sp. YN15 TaxID=1742774 RepID=UPI001C6575CB|nr:heme ABC transporter substrate-binding protein IsdE [Paenibacillus sp. YN15]